MSNDLTTTELAETRCPTCDHKLDMATSASFDTKTPEPEDITICFYCAAPLIFTDTLGVRRMSDDEWLDLPDEDRILLKRLMDGLIEFNNAHPG